VITQLQLINIIIIIITLREKLKLRVFENRALRKIFGLKREEVTREWGEIA
jgi:hypothetical protein